MANLAGPSMALQMFGTLRVDGLCAIERGLYVFKKVPSDPQQHSHEIHQPLFNPVVCCLLCHANHGAFCILTTLQLGSFRPWPTTCRCGLFKGNPSKLWRFSCWYPFQATKHAHKKGEPPMWGSKSRAGGRPSFELCRRCAMPSPRVSSPSASQGPS